MQYNLKNINLIEDYILYTFVQLCSAAFQTVECKIQNTTVLQNSRGKCMLHAVCFAAEVKPNLTPECSETTPEC